MKKYAVSFEEHVLYKTQVVEAESKDQAIDNYDLESAEYDVDGRYTVDELEV